MNYITTYLRKIISRGYYSTIHLYKWIVLFCAVIRAINYTDWHDVDEESMTITSCGGWWGSDNMTGVAARDQYSTPTDSGDSVASKKNNIHNVKK